MLTDLERREIEHELTHYPDRRAACVEALKIVQRRHGWVSDENLKGVAELLGMTADELDGVATFYNLIFRKPVGRHVVFICNSISCWTMGYDVIRHAITQRLGVTFGQTTPDKRFTVLPIVCLGACDHAPVIMIDEDLHGKVEPDKVDAILDRYR